MQQLRAKVFKLTFEYLDFIVQQVAKTIAKLPHKCLVNGQIYGKHWNTVRAEI